MITSNPEAAIEVDALAAILRTIPMDGIASYDELSDVVGYPIQRRRFALMKALKMVEQETGLRFATVHGKGIKLLSSQAVPGIGADARKAIARKAKRQASRLTGLKYNDIDRDAQARIDAERSLLGAISSVARTNPEKIQDGDRTGPLVASRVFMLLGNSA